MPESGILNGVGESAVRSPTYCGVKGLELLVCEEPAEVPPCENCPKLPPCEDEAASPCAKYID